MTNAPARPPRWTPDKVTVGCPVYRSVEGRTVVSLIDVVGTFRPRSIAITTGCSISSNYRAIFATALECPDGALVTCEADMIFGTQDVRDILALLEEACRVTKNDLNMVGSVYPHGDQAGLRVGGRTQDACVDRVLRQGDAWECAEVGLGFTAISCAALRKVTERFGIGVAEWTYEGGETVSPDATLCRQLADVGGAVWATDAPQGVGHVTRYAMRASATGARFL